MKNIKSFVLVSLFALLVASCGGTSSQTSTIEKRVAAQFAVGVGTHAMASYTDPDIVYPLAARAGVVAFRDDLSWPLIETARDQYTVPDKLENTVNRALAEGIQPLAVLCYGNKFHDNGGMPETDEEQAAYARYAAFVATHFIGRINRFEIWNEWNLNAGTTKRYVVVKSFYRGLLARGRNVDLGADPAVMAMVAAYEAKTISRDKMITTLFNSTEGQAVYPSTMEDADFVDRLYANSLSRTPTTAERETALAALAGGTARAEVARQLVITAEYTSSWRSHGDVATYVRLVSKTSAALKQVNPAITVIAGAVGGKDSSWLERMVQGGVLESADALSIHPYNFSEGVDGTPEKLLDWLDGAEASLVKLTGGKGIPLYLTEIGWPTQTGGNGTLAETSGDYLARLYLLARTRPYLKGIYWYDFQDDGTSPTNTEQNFGIVRNDLTPKPAYDRLATIARPAAYGLNAERLPSDPNLVAVRFHWEDGTATVALWAVGVGASCDVTITPSSSVRLSVNSAAAGQVTTQFIGAMTGGPITLRVAATPILVNGSLDGLKLATNWLTPTQ